MSVLSVYAHRCLFGEWDGIDRRLVRACVVQRVQCKVLITYQTYLTCVTRHGVWAVHGLSFSGGLFATGGGDASVKIWAPTTNINIGEVNGADAMDGGGETESEQNQQHQRWECVGGVRGAAGAVGTVFMDQEALVFGTSEALITRFPLQLCMPKSQPA